MSAARHTKRKARRGPLATIEDLVAMDYAPIPELVAPTNQQWLDPTLAMVRVAAVFCQRSKTENVNHLAAADDAFCMGVFDRLRETREYLEAVTEVMKTAELRLMAALAVITQTRPDTTLEPEPPAAP